MHSGHCKTLHSTTHTNKANKTENPLHGSTFCAAAICRAVRQTIGLRQSFRDPHYLMIGGKSWGNHAGLGCGGVCQSGAEVSSTRWRPRWVNLRRFLWEGARNVLTCLHHLLSSSTLTSSMQHSLRFRPDRGQIMAGGYTYYWFGHSDGYHAQEVAVAMPN